MLWVGAFFCFNVLQPVYMWSFASASNILSLGVILLLCIKHFRIDNFDFAKLLYIIVYIILASLAAQNFLGFLGCALLPFLMMSDENFLYELYDRFVTIFVVFTTISLMVYVLVVLGAPLGYTIIPPLNPLQEITYRYYPFMVTMNSADYYRFMGMFDEPGAMGTLSGVLLLMNKLKLSDKRNVLILLFGFFSFSLFFYLVLGAYIVLFAPKKIKIITFGIVFAVLLLPSNNILDQYIFSRIAFVDGEFVGDDRKVWNFDDVWFEHYKQSSDYYWGLGREAKAVYNSGGSSYVDLLIMYGLVFTVFYSFVFLYDATKRLAENKKNIAIYLLIFSSVMYQRPYINNIGYLMMLYMPMVFLSKKTNNEYERK